jgi:hypothetical protein
VSSALNLELSSLVSGNGNSCFQVLRPKLEGPPWVLFFSLAPYPICQQILLAVPSKCPQHLTTYLTLPLPTCLATISPLASWSPLFLAPFPPLPLPLYLLFNIVVPVILYTCNRLGCVQQQSKYGRACVRPWVPSPLPHSHNKNIGMSLLYSIPVHVTHCKSLCNDLPDPVGLDTMSDSIFYLFTCWVNQRCQ